MPGQREGDADVASSIGRVNEFVAELEHNLSMAYPETAGALQIIIAGDVLVLSHWTMAQNIIPNG